MPSAKDAALALLLLYAAVLTYIHFGQRPNPICARDFVDPKLRGSCFSGADGYSMCTPSLAADVIIELLDARGEVESLVFIVRGDGRGLGCSPPTCGEASRRRQRRAAEWHLHYVLLPTYLLLLTYSHLNVLDSPSVRVFHPLKLASALVDEAPSTCPSCRSRGFRRRAGTRPCGRRSLTRS